MGEFSSVGSQKTSRRDQILELRKAGLSYAEIGRRLGMTRERARQICNGKSAPERPDLRTKPVLSISKVASLLGLHVNTARRWSDNGVIRAYRMGSSHDRRFRREDIDSFPKEDKPGNMSDA